MVDADRFAPSGGTICAEVAEIGGDRNPVKIEPIPFDIPGAVIKDADAPLTHRIAMFFLA
jgi:hypothetical protein